MAARTDNIAHDRCASVSGHEARDKGTCFWYQPWQQSVCRQAADSGRQGGTARQPASHLAGFALPRKGNSLRGPIRAIDGDARLS